MQCTDGRKLYILANQPLAKQRQKHWEEMPSRRFSWLFSPRTGGGGELGSLMDQFMGDLSRENRMILLRRYWYMDTVPEIAARFGLSEQSVRSRLRRTQGRLCTYLERQGVCL